MPGEKRLGSMTMLSTADRENEGFCVLGHESGKRSRTCLKKTAPQPSAAGRAEGRDSGAAVFGTESCLKLLELIDGHRTPIAGSLGRRHRAIV